MLQKQEHIEDEKHRRWIASLPCATSGVLGSTQCAHIRRNSNAGTGRKPSDSRCIPLSIHEHARQHKEGELQFYNEFGGWERAVVLAKELHAISGDTPAALRLLHEFRASGIRR